MSSAMTTLDRARRMLSQPWVWMFPLKWAAYCLTRGATHHRTRRSGNAANPVCGPRRGRTTLGKPTHLTADDSVVIENGVSSAQGTESVELATTNSRSGVRRPRPPVMSMCRMPFRRSTDDNSTIDQGRMVKS